MKIVVAGGFGVGKTTMVGAVSEIEPLTTEEYLTTASATTDTLTGIEAKDTTTVSLDFGRITLPQPESRVLYLFGTPGQDRFLFTWDDLVHGALGAVILVDTRRLPVSFTAVDYFLHQELPFVVAVNTFPDAHDYSPDEVREALELPDQILILPCDARQPTSAASVLMALLRYAVDLATSTRPTAQGIPA